MRKPKLSKKWTLYLNHLLSKLPSDEDIDNHPASDYAKAYYQGKFDILMDLINEVE